jgi:4-hydroxybenzoate polyprenyltransferase
MGTIKSFLNRIEDSGIGFGLWVCTALCIIFIRDFLESTLNFSSFGEITSFHFVHLPVFFISILLAIIISLHLFSKVEITKVSRVSLIFFGIIVLPIFLDFFVYSALGEDMDYLYIVENLKGNFLNFLNPFVKIQGITYGIRTEIAAISILSFFYIFIKRNKIFLSLLGSFFIFVMCFFYLSISGMLIGFLKFLSSFIPYLKVDDKILLNMFTTDKLAESRVTIAGLVITSLLAAVWFWRYDRSKFNALFKNLRFTRSIHYISLVIIGIAFNLAFNLYSSGLPSDFSLIRLTGVILAIFFAFQFSVIINDIYDVNCDKISNKNRPLVVGALSKEEYLKVGLVYLVFALLFALSINDIAFRGILIFIALYFIYSVPPFRLKRFFPLSSIIIAVQAILAFLLGYLFLEVPGASMEVPAKILWLLFFAFLLASSVKDLKDIEGDKVSDSYTLPVILGEANAKKIIGISVCISYLSVAIFLPGIFGFSIQPAFLMLTLIFGIFNLFYIIRKDAKEQIIFSGYFIYIFFILLFLISKII